MCKSAHTHARKIFNRLSKTINQTMITNSCSFIHQCLKVTCYNQPQIRSILFQRFIITEVFPHNNHSSCCRLQLPAVSGLQQAATPAQNILRTAVVLYNWVLLFFEEVISNRQEAASPSGWTLCSWQSRLTWCFPLWRARPLETKRTAGEFNLIADIIYQ